jgi:hypothetical protein
MSALKNFNRWIYLMQQIHEACYYIGRAEELGHPHLLKSYDEILEFLAYFRSALNSYAKCFASAGPGRKRLESSSLFGADDSRLKQQHNRIIELRNKYVAHSDNNEFESANVLEEETASELTLRLQYKFSFPFDRLYELRELIRFIEGYVVDRQKEHIAGIEREVEKPVRVLEGGR